MLQKLYMETSVISYRASRASGELLVAARQEITRAWWQNGLPEFEVFVSDIVLQEAAQGDGVAARERLRLLEGYPVLALTAEAERLARLYMRAMPLPSKAIRDALHMSIASVSGMDYLVTWNCRHIAHGRIKRRLQELNTSEGIRSPVICTPEELGGDIDAE